MDSSNHIQIILSFVMMFVALKCCSKFDLDYTIYVEQGNELQALGHFNVNNSVSRL